MNWHWVLGLHAVYSVLLKDYERIDSNVYLPHFQETFIWYFLGAGYFSKCFLYINMFNIIKPDKVVPFPFYIIENEAKRIKKLLQDH